MITKIKDRWQNIPTLNFGVAFLQVFIWLNLILLALLFEKGIETIFNLFDFNETQEYNISLWPSIDNITWMFVIYFLLFINFIVFSLRYLFWTPWPIYNNIFNLRKIEGGAFPKIDIHGNDECVKGTYSNINFNRLIWGLTNSNGSEIFWSGLILLIEFYIVYLGIMSLGNIQITIAFLFALPLIDFFIPFFSSIFRIKKKHFKREHLKNFFNGKGVKHYFKSRKWLLPWVFLRPFIYDIFIPIIFIIIVVLYIIFTDYKDITLKDISISDFIEKYQFQLTLTVIVSLTLTNFLVIKFLRNNYYNVGLVLFKLSDIKKEIHSPNRPEAYVIGKSDFMETELYIDERVYPPTIETEFLVECAINELNKYKVKTPEVLDIGTGSGNIAISIARKFDKIDIIAIDKSNEALDLANENIEKFNIKSITLQESDLLKNINNKKLNNPDLIVANLPYGSEDFLLESNPIESIKFMPTIAVFPTKGIIGDYVDLVSEILKKEWNTVLLIEIGPITEDIITNEFPEKMLKKIKYEILSKKIKVSEDSEEKTYSVLKVKFNHGK